MTFATALLAIEADKVQAGWIALVFVAALGVAVFLLIRSMNKHLKKVDFERSDERGRHDVAGGPGPQPGGPS